VCGDALLLKNQTSARNGKSSIKTFFCVTNQPKLIYIILYTNSVIFSTTYMNFARIRWAIHFFPFILQSIITFAPPGILESWWEGSSVTHLTPLLYSISWGLKLSRRWKRGMWSSGLWRHGIMWLVITVSELRITSIFKVTEGIG
jgi:hypothetical protein